MADGSIDKVKNARDKLAEAFENEVKDDVYDNGLLTLIAKACQDIEIIIKTLIERENKEEEE